MPTTDTGDVIPYEEPEDMLNPSDIHKISDFSGLLIHILRTLDLKLRETVTGSTSEISGSVSNHTQLIKGLDKAITEQKREYAVLSSQTQSNKEALSATNLQCRNIQRELEDLKVSTKSDMATLQGTLEVQLTESVESLIDKLSISNKDIPPIDSDMSADEVMTLFLKRVESLESKMMKQEVANVAMKKALSSITDAQSSRIDQLESKLSELERSHEEGMLSYNKLHDKVEYMDLTQQTLKERVEGVSSSLSEIHKELQCNNMKRSDATSTLIEIIRTARNESPRSHDSRADEMPSEVRSNVNPGSVELHTKSNSSKIVSGVKENEVSKSPSKLVVPKLNIAQSITKTSNRTPDIEVGQCESTANDTVKSTSRESPREKDVLAEKVQLLLKANAKLESRVNSAEANSRTMYDQLQTLLGAVNALGGKNIHIPKGGESSNNGLNPPVCTKYSNVLNSSVTRKSDSGGDLLPATSLATSSVSSPKTHPGDGISLIGTDKGDGHKSESEELSNSNALASSNNVGATPQSLIIFDSSDQRPSEQLTQDSSLSGFPEILRRARSGSNVSISNSSLVTTAAVMPADDDGNISDIGSVTSLSVVDEFVLEKIDLLEKTNGVLKQRILANERLSHDINSQLQAALEVLHRHFENSEILLEHEGNGGVIDQSVPQRNTESNHVSPNSSHTSKISATPLDTISLDQPPKPVVVDNQPVGPVLSSRQITRKSTVDSYGVMSPVVKPQSPVHMKMHHQMLSHSLAATEPSSPVKDLPVDVRVDSYSMPSNTSPHRYTDDVLLQRVDCFEDRIIKQEETYYKTRDQMQIIMDAIKDLSVTTEELKSRPVAVAPQRRASVGSTKEPWERATEDLGRKVADINRMLKQLSMQQKKESSVLTKLQSDMEASLQNTQKSPPVSSCLDGESDAKASGETLSAVDRPALTTSENLPVSENAATLSPEINTPEIVIEESTKTVSVEGINDTNLAIKELPLKTVSAEIDVAMTEDEDYLGFEHHSIDRMFVQQRMEELEEQLANKASVESLEKMIQDLRVDISMNSDKLTRDSFSQQEASSALMKHFREHVDDEIDATRKLMAKNATTAYQMISDSSAKTLPKDEVLDRFSQVGNVLEKIQSQLGGFLPKRDAERAIRELRDESMETRNMMITPSMLDERLDKKADKREVDRLVKSLTNIIGDPYTSTAAAMHKCLVCDKPVSSNTDSPIRPSTGYDKALDPHIYSPIKRPTSSSAVDSKNEDDVVVLKNAMALPPVVVPLGMEKGRTPLYPKLSSRYHGEQDPLLEVAWREFISRTPDE